MINIDLQITNAKTNVHKFHSTHTTEYYVVISPDYNLSFPEQFKQIMESLSCLLVNENCTNNNLIFLKYFLSDATNQVEELSQQCLLDNDLHQNTSYSFIQQAPSDGSKVNLLLYMIKSPSLLKTKLDDSSTVFKLNGYSHLWTFNMKDLNEKDSYNQTFQIFSKYSNTLSEFGMNLKDNCHRTWFYIRDIDKNYEGMVQARNQYFDKLGLTNDTHYITSTGIEGNDPMVEPYVVMDAYSISGLQSNQVEYIKCPKYLNNTNEYGVAFERGTIIKYGDREHFYISGTASIDNKGEVLYKHNVIKQTERIILNISKLLNVGNSDLKDISHIIVYLRDTSDYNKVKSLLDTAIPQASKVFVKGSVCRPEWLVEVECVAIRDTNYNQYNPY